MKQLSSRALALMMALLMLMSSAVWTSAANVEPVKNLSAKYSAADGVSLSWSKAEDAHGYRIFRYEATEKSWKAIKTTTELSYTDTNVVAGGVYYYTVRAYRYINSKAVFSGNSNKVKVIVAPEKVTGLRVVAYNESSISVTWTKQQGVTGYMVYMYNPTAMKYQLKSMVTGNNCILTDLKMGTVYYIAVRAYVTHGKTVSGEFSSVLTATTKGPVVPTKLKGVSYPSNGEIKLTWTGSPSNTGYVVYQYDSSTGGWKEIARVKSAKHTVTGITETSTYTFAVCGYTTGNGKTYYSDKSQSVTVSFKISDLPDNGYSQDMAEKGIFGYLYDPSERCFYTASDPWQRLVGYNAIFDVCAPFVFIDFDTVRLDFKYKNKDWRVQLWKGQYGLAFYGCEVGVYTKPSDRKLAHYNCAADEDMLMMQVDFLQKKSGNSDTWIRKFSRPYGSYWWCTGFIPGNLFGNFDILKLDMRITMKDYEMLSGFTSALAENGIKYTVRGLDVYFIYE